MIVPTIDISKAFSLLEQYLSPIHHCGIWAYSGGLSVTDANFNANNKTRTMNIGARRYILTYKDLDDVLYRLSGLERKHPPLEITLILEDCVILESEVKGRFCSNINRVQLKSCVIIPINDRFKDGSVYAPREVCMRCKHAIFIEVKSNTDNWVYPEEWPKNSNCVGEQGKTPCSMADFEYQPSDVTKQYTTQAGELKGFSGVEPIIISETLDME